MKRPGLRGSLWPSEDEEDLLRICLGSGEAARSAWGRIEPRLDIDHAPADVYRILPLLGSALKALDIRTPVLPRLRGLYRKTWTLNQILLDRTAGIVRVLDEAGIPSVILKGCAISLRYFGDVGLRPMGDIDVLVPPEHARTALGRLVEAGWLDVTERRPGGTVFRHTHAFSLEGGPHVGCDLHWTIGEHMLVGPGQDPTARFWPVAQPFEVAGVRTLALNDTDQLLHVILHGAQPGGPSRLQWITDAAQILRTSEMDWDRLEDLAIDMRDTIRISDALAYLAGVFVPERVPPGVIARLRAFPVPAHERIEYALSAGGTGPGVGMFPATVANFVRETRGWSLGRRTRLFPRYLQEVWELENLGQVPGQALRKAANTLRGRATGPS
jgi:putative nucleotidyltransferase-like protein